MLDRFQPELWRDLYVMLGTSSAALVGLLFVVTSLHLSEIVNKPGLRVRARSNMVYLLTTLVEAAVILTPQRPELLGGELIIINLIMAQRPITNVYNIFKHTEMATQARFSIYRALTFVGCFALGIAGGMGIISDANWGMQLVTVSYITFVVLTALNAWQIMLGVGQAELLSEEK